MLHPSSRGFRNLLATLVVAAAVILWIADQMRDWSIRSEMARAAAAKFKADSLRADSVVQTAKAAVAQPPKPPPPDVSTLPAVRVLFIGNSLVYTWNMPAMLMQLARAGRVNLQVTQHAPEGSTFQEHDRSPELGALIDSGHWDVVVLQEQTQRPAQPDDWVRANVDPPATRLVNRARGSSPTARVVFYQTPARESGDFMNVSKAPELATYGGMQDRVTNTYRRLATVLDADVAPAGEAWRRVRDERPELELYRDGVNPSREGAYLIACVFYATLLDKNPTGSRYIAGIDSASARYLQRVAWETTRVSVSGSYRP